MILEQFWRRRGKEGAAQENEMKSSYGVGDAGFTLVEVIIAMAILALISVPLLGYFTNSAKYNALMASEQKATALAQRIVEDLKEQDSIVEEDSSATYGYSSEYLRNAKYNLAGETESLSTTGAYSLWSLQYDGQAATIGENYDVRITLSDTDDNHSSVVSIPNVDSTTDVIAMESNQLSDAAAYFETLNAMYASTNGTSTATDAQVKAKMQRTLTVLIEDSGSHYHVKVSCSYTCDGIDGTSGVTYDASDFLDTYINTLEKIYIMFDANLMTGKTTGAADDIVIVENDTTNTSIDLILSCQNIDEVNAYTDYKMTVEASSASTWINSVLGTIRTNLPSLDGGSKTITYEASLTSTGNETRRVDIEVSVYKKGTMDTTDEKKYITVDATYDL